jgi:hypothetical protein
MLHGWHGGLRLHGGAMNERRLVWGPAARGLFQALLWLTIIVGLAEPEWLLYYLGLLLFLVFALAPVLEVCGAYDLYVRISKGIDDFRWKKITEKRRKEVERKARDAKYRDRRYKDPRLPPNW